MMDEFIESCGKLWEGLPFGWALVKADRFGIPIVRTNLMFSDRYGSIDLRAVAQLEGYERISDFS